MSGHKVVGVNEIMDYSNAHMDHDQLVARKLAIHLCFLVVGLLLILGIKTVILGTNTVVKLKSAAELAGAISQSQATDGANAKVPTEGIDYKVQELRYLDNKAWAVVKVGPVSGNTDRGTLVLERKDNGSYVVVLGPGTAFSSGEVEKLPTDVLQYIKNHGVLIYEPAS